MQKRMAVVLSKWIVIAKRPNEKWKTFEVEAESADSAKLKFPEKTRFFGTPQKKEAKIK